MFPGTYVLGFIIGSAMTTTSTKAIGYARVSTDEQAREGVSLEVQRSRIRAYCEAKELELVDMLTDDGISGKTLERPALHELVARCERGEVGNVVVVKLDRLTRRTRDLLALVDDLFLARKIELHSVSESLDTSTPHGRFVLTLFGGLAQMERELIGERTRSALDYKRQQGQPTNHPPYGFRPNGRRERMIPVPEELAVVRRIVDGWRAGGTYAGLAARLNGEGVPTKRGRRWHASTVRGIVQRRDWYREVLGAT
jgi:DNA invertase Pin-like site-specific DNA recombinase